MNNFPLIASLTLSLLLCACGGGGESEPVSIPNAQALSVGPGPSNNVNLLFTSVQICTPGSSSNCQTIDHVLVDTGSSGLRSFSSLANSSLASPRAKDGLRPPLVESRRFGLGFVWAPGQFA